MRDYVPGLPRAELRRHRGEDVALLWYAHTTGEVVWRIVRFTVDANTGAIVHVREYYCSPDALAELWGELAVPQQRLRDLTTRRARRRDRGPFGKLARGANKVLDSALSASRVAIDAAMRVSHGHRSLTHQTSLP
jgi:hypothetical protein